MEFDTGALGTFGAGVGGGGALVLLIRSLLDYMRGTRQDVRSAHEHLIATLSARVATLEALCTTQGETLTAMATQLAATQTELRYVKEELSERDAKIASLREQRSELRRTAPIEIGADTSTPVAGLPAAHRGDGQ